MNRLLLVVLLFFVFPNNDSHGATDSIPVFPDLVYEYRITELNNLTPIELDYNKYVRRYIDVYTIERREHMEKIAGRAQKYFPMIEEKLDKYNLPLELKYLAIVESALDPFAVSSSGAVGLWQFKLNTSRMFDLKVTSYIDERRDPYKSTEAACKYLKYLYNNFNNWQLALAAYNGGPGVVRKAIERAGEKKSFWELYEYMPAQTKGYVPAFIAVNYAMNHMDKHGLTPVEPEYKFFETDTLMVHYETSFQGISKALDIPVPSIRRMNPLYRRDVIPNLPEATSLILPKDKVLVFLRNEKKIYNTTPLKNEDRAADTAMLSDNNKEKITHTVRKGEYFHKIAMNYGCTIEQIRQWNNLPNNNLKVGQKLDIWVDPSYIEKVNNEKMKIRRRAEADTNKRVIFYTVRKGDTIWSIANKFNCESVADLIEMNDIDDETDIKPGKKIKIYLGH
jgi:membrane-bound lytic murein transglycosylase D